MRICFNEATAMKCSTLENDLELCEKRGYDYIEIRTDMLRDFLTRRPLAALREFFAGSRLKPHAINAIYTYQGFLSDHDDPVRRQALLDETLLAFMAAKEIGSHYVIVVPPLNRDPKGPPYQGTWEGTRQECVRILLALSDMAVFYDVNLCFELVGASRCSVRTIPAAKAIVEEVNRDNVGYVFDSYNIFLYDQANDYSGIKSVESGKIFAAHINNADPVPVAEMAQDKRRFCDQGALDLGNFIGSLAASGYDGMLSIETFRQEYYAKNAEWVIDEAYRTTRAVMRKYGAD